MSEAKCWKIEDVFKLPEGDLRFYGHLGVTEILEEEEAVSTVMSVTRELTNGHLTAQGGALYALADIACAAFMRIKYGNEVTLSGSVNFYAPAVPGDVLSARCTARRVGKTIGTVFCEVRNGAGKLILDSTQVFYRLYD